MLAHKPHLKFVRAQHIADKKIIRAVTLLPVFVVEISLMISIPLLL